jgi:hypothetical protein
MTAWRRVCVTSLFFVRGVGVWVSVRVVCVRTRPCQLGSTIVLVFEAPPEFVFTLGANSKVRLGQAIGVITTDAESSGSDGEGGEGGLGLDAADTGSGGSGGGSAAASESTGAWGWGWRGAPSGG